MTDPADLEGVPPSAMALFAQQAKNDGHEKATATEGPWLLTLDMPCFLPISRFAKNRYAILHSAPTMPSFY